MIFLYNSNAIVFSDIPKYQLSIGYPIKLIRLTSFNTKLLKRVRFLTFPYSFNVRLKLTRLEKSIFFNAPHKTNETCNQPMLPKSKFMLSRFNEINGRALYDRFQARARWYNR